MNKYFRTSNIVFKPLLVSSFHNLSHLLNKCKSLFKKCAHLKRTKHSYPQINQSECEKNHKKRRKSLWQPSVKVYKCYPNNYMKNKKQKKSHILHLLSTNPAQLCNYELTTLLTNRRKNLFYNFQQFF